MTTYLAALATVATITSIVRLVVAIKQYRKGGP